MNEKASLQAPFIESIVGKPLARIWRGHGSAIFLEFGKLSRATSKLGKTHGPFGEASLMIEWSWRIEKARSILGGSWSNESRWQYLFDQIVGAKAEKVVIAGPLPEICVFLSNGMRVSSFMTAEGQPAWAILTGKPRIGSLLVKRGVLVVEPPAS